MDSIDWSTLPRKILYKINGCLGLEKDKNLLIKKITEIFVKNCSYEEIESFIKKNLWVYDASPNMQQKDSLAMLAARFVVEKSTGLGGQPIRNNPRDEAVVKEMSLSNRSPACVEATTSTSGTPQTQNVTISVTGNHNSVHLNFQ